MSVRTLLAGHHLGRPALRLQLTVLYAGFAICLVTAVLLATNVLFRFGSSSSAAGAAAGSAGANGAAGATVTGHSAEVAWVIVGLIVVAASLALAWWIAGRFLRPLRAMTTAARQISATNLSRRLNLSGPDDELTELGRTLDDLFGRLEASFESQRHFVANASHELRTPLTAQRSLLQVTLADPQATTGTLRSACEEVLTLGGHQARLIDALLTLASSERGVESWESLDLAAIVDGIVLLRRDEAERRAITVEAKLDGAPTVGDQSLVESLVANLVDNALRYNVAGGSLAVTSGQRAGCAVVSVTNTGPVVPAEEVERLFEPFRRAGVARTRSDGGHGLGLSIVRAVADAHAAVVTVEPRPEGGLRVEVVFPAPDARQA